MNVILLDNVENLGKIGDLVKVKPGNMKQIEARRAELEKAAAEDLAAARTRAAGMEGTELVIQANAGPEGKLFGSVGPIDIADAFEKVQVEVQRSEIRMPEGPIQELGEFPVGVHLHPEVNVEITIRVVEVE
jgi:large subunit ribosomal protein L9